MLCQKLLYFGYLNLKRFKGDKLTMGHQELGAC